MKLCQNRTARRGQTNFIARQQPTRNAEQAFGATNAGVRTVIGNELLRIQRQRADLVATLFADLPAAAQRFITGTLVVTARSKAEIEPVRFCIRMRRRCRRLVSPFFVVDVVVWLVVVLSPKPAAIAADVIAANPTAKIAIVIVNVRMPLLASGCLRIAWTDRTARRLAILSRVRSRVECATMILFLELVPDFGRDRRA